MKRSTLLIALVALCIHGCMGGPVNDVPKNYVEYLYIYNGYVDTKTTANEDTIGRWNITGKLTIQAMDKQMIFKLHDLKASLFNGYIADLNNTHYEDIPKEAEILEQPFLFTLSNSEVSVEPNEPLWSVNFKRAIASNFHELSEGIHYEKTVFGDCETHYDFTNKENIVKTIDHDLCKVKPYKYRSNVRPAPAPKGFQTIQIKTVVEIKPSNNLPQNIRSVSQLTYKSMPSAPNTLHIDQHQEFYLQKVLTDFEQINTEKITEHKPIAYKYGEENTHGRHQQDHNAKVLIQQYLEAYDRFEKTFKDVPIENRLNTTEDPMDDMFTAMYEMKNEQGYKDLQEQVENKETWESYSIFVGLLPYIGTKHSISHIAHMISKGELDKIPYQALNILAIFPSHIDELTDEMIQSLEVMLNVEKSELETTRHALVLSFASVMARAEENGISEKVFRKYQNLYHKNFLETENYDLKMAYLLGLVNMAEGLPHEFIISIIKNTQDNNLRSLALAGFANTLNKANETMIFDIFWPMVSNKTENFDIRIAALDLLLSIKLNAEQFNTILAAYLKHRDGNVYAKHLSNYFLTSLESFQNNTAYQDPIGDLATATLANEHFPIHKRPWTTGNYRLSYSDAEPNLGGYIHAKLIANPVLSTPSTVQLSYNKFAWSFDTGVYTIYLKLNGIFEFTYMQSFLQQVPKDTSVPELLKIIKDFDFKMKKFDQDSHVEIVVFKNSKAVFFMHMDEKNYKEKREKLNTLMDEIITNGYSISFPIMDYTHIPSIFGTPINIMHDMQEVTHFGFPKNDFTYRSSWSYQTWLESYNPILDTTISTFTYYGDQKGINTKASFNPRRLVLAWVTKYDSFTWVWDSLAGTVVEDDKVLHTYCPICQGVYELKSDTFFHNSTKNLTLLGMSFNYTQLQTYDPFDETNYGENIIFNFFNNTHISNSDAVPLAKPLLAVLHFHNFKNTFRNEGQRGSYRSIPLVENGTKSIIDIAGENSQENTILDPFEDAIINITVRIFHKELDAEEDEEQNIEDWYFTYEIITSHNETGKVKVTHKFFGDNFKSNAETIKICSSHSTYLPGVNSDKFSIVPVDDLLTAQIINFDKLPPYETPPGWSPCTPNHTVILSGAYRNAAERINKLKESADYKQCQKESKGLKFTPPTHSCISSFHAANEYDQFAVDGNTNDTQHTDEDLFRNNPIFKFYRVGYNKLKFVFANPMNRDTDAANAHVEFVSYFPYHIRNPASEVYGDDDMKTSCIVTPKKITSFTGHDTPNAGTTEVAFVECFENAMRGLTTEKISDTHIGFKFWSNNNTVEATLKEDKLHIVLNEKKLKGSHFDKENKINVRFLDDNVVFISDARVTVYYNTEYIYIKANPFYNNILCGLCSEV